MVAEIVPVNDPSALAVTVSDKLCAHAAGKKRVRNDVEPEPLLILTAVPASANPGAPDTREMPFASGDEIERCDTGEGISTVGVEPEPELAEPPQPLTVTRQKTAIMLINNLLSNFIEPPF